MRVLHVVVASAVLFVTNSAQGGEESGRPDAGHKADRAIVGDRDGEADDLMEGRLIGLLWLPVLQFRPPVDKDTILPAPSRAYAQIWQPEWQQVIGLTAEQKAKLLAIHSAAMAEAEDQKERTKDLEREERRAKMKTWREQYDRDLCRKIEGVLTAGQERMIKDDAFPGYVIRLLDKGEVREEVGFRQDQEDALRGLARERLARFQEVWLQRAEELWGLLTPEQQAAMPEVVKHQGPTSAVLSIAWELGFDLDRVVPTHPMLAEKPVRERLGLSADQEKQLEEIMAETAVRERRRREARRSGEEESFEHSAARLSAVERRVEAILTPAQLAALEEIDFRRKIVLAFAYPEKRESVGVTAEQEADRQRLEQETYRRMWEIDREMLGKVLAILTPDQQRQLREKVDGMFYRKSAAG